MNIQNGNYVAKVSGNKTTFKVLDFTYIGTSRTAIGQSNVCDIVTVQDNIFTSKLLGHLHKIVIHLN